jgi:ribosomal protein S8
MKFILKSFFSNLCNNQGVNNILLYHKKNKFLFVFLKTILSLELIRGFKIEDRFLKILLKYYKNKPVISNIFFQNKYYISYISLCKLKESHIIYLISTSKGLVTHSEAINLKLGGYLICKII